MTRAVRAVPDAMAARRHVTFGGSVACGWLSDDLHPSGVVGDPTLATAGRGAALVDAMMMRLSEEFAEVAAVDFPAG